MKTDNPIINILLIPGISMAVIAMLSAIYFAFKGAWLLFGYGIEKGGWLGNGIALIGAILLLYITYLFLGGHYIPFAS